MKKLNVKCLRHYLAKRITQNAEWDENLGNYYVKLNDGWISLTAEEYKYLKKVAKMGDEEN